MPRGPTYVEPAYQTCAVPGARPGSLVVQGEDYLMASFGFAPDHIFPNVISILVLALIALVASVIFTSLLSFTRLGAIRVFTEGRGEGRKSAQVASAHPDTQIQDLIPDVEAADLASTAQFDESRPLLETSPLDPQATVPDSDAHQYDPATVTVSISDRFPNGLNVSWLYEKTALDRSHPSSRHVFMGF